MSREAAKSLGMLIGQIAGLQEMHSDPLINEAGRNMNTALGMLLVELLGPDAAEALFEEATEIVNTRLREGGFGEMLQIRTHGSLEREAKATTDELLAKLREGGL